MAILLHLCLVCLYRRQWRASYDIAAGLILQIRILRWYAKRVLFLYSLFATRYLLLNSGKCCRVLSV